MGPDNMTLLQIAISVIATIHKTSESDVCFDLKVSKKNQFFPQIIFSCFYYVSGYGQRGEGLLFCGYHGADGARTVGARGSTAKVLHGGPKGVQGNGQGQHQQTCGHVRQI